MTYAPLPAVLSIGQRIVQPRYADEVLEIMSVDDVGGCLLRRNNGNAVTRKYTRDELALWDYKLVVEDGQQCPIVPHN